MELTLPSMSRPQPARCLPTKPPVGAHLARHPRHLRGERAQLVQLRIDGFLELQDLPAHIHRDLLRQVPVRHRDRHVGQTPHMRRLLVTPRAETSRPQSDNLATPRYRHWQRIRPGNSVFRLPPQEQAALDDQRPSQSHNPPQPDRLAAAVVKISLRRDKYS
jgi:hypothetical protein